MFSTNIKIAEKYDYLVPKFTTAYRWLASTDLDALPAGEYYIDDTYKVQVMEYTTKPIEECRFETHDKFFDIQYVVSGLEAFGVVSRDSLQVNEKIPEKDLTFYDLPENYGQVILGPGDFIVVAPEDGHCPKASAKEPTAVKKIVIKIPVA